jgi:hypothetical protein
MALVHRKEVRLKVEGRQSLGLEFPGVHEQHSLLSAAKVQTRLSVLTGRARSASFCCKSSQISFIGVPWGGEPITAFCLMKA